MWSSSPDHTKAKKPRCIKEQSLLHWAIITWTTVMLSHKHLLLVPVGPHMLHAATMGIDSCCNVMGRPFSSPPSMGAGTMPAAMQPHSPTALRWKRHCRGPSGPVYLHHASCIQRWVKYLSPSQIRPELCVQLYPVVWVLCALPWLTSRLTYSKIPDWAVPPCMHVTASQLKKVVHVSCMLSWAPSCWAMLSACPASSLVAESLSLSV